MDHGNGFGRMVLGATEVSLPTSILCDTVMQGLDMGRIKRGGYIFFTAKGDHNPPHVHIYRDGEMVAKFDLQDWQPMTGKVDRRVKQILRRLREDGRL